jgi:hypothetical protein
MGFIRYHSLRCAAEPVGLRGSISLAENTIAKPMCDWIGWPLYTAQEREAMRADAPDMIPAHGSLCVVRPSELANSREVARA